MMNSSKRLKRVLALVPPLILASGCATGVPRTWVEGGVKPSHFQFKDVVPRRGHRVGGWRAACLHVGIMRDTSEELVYCRLGVEVPIQNEAQGFIPLEVAQSRAAHGANEAAWTTLMATTPIAVACEEFRSLFDMTFKEIILGSAVVRACYSGVTPVVLTPSHGSLPSR